jgi:hypothetical protein
MKFPSDPSHHFVCTLSVLECTDTEGKINLPQIGGKGGNLVRILFLVEFRV